MHFTVWLASFAHPLFRAFEHHFITPLSKLYSVYLQEENVEGGEAEEEEEEEEEREERVSKRPRSDFIHEEAG